MMYIKLFMSFNNIYFHILININDNNSQFAQLKSQYDYKLFPAYDMCFITIGGIDVVIWSKIHTDNMQEYNPKTFQRMLLPSIIFMEHGGVGMKSQKISTVFVFLILFFSILMAVEAQRPELEVRQKGGIFLNVLNYSLEVTGENTVEATCSITMTNIGDETFSEMSFDLVLQSGEIEYITFSDESGTALVFQTTQVGAHHLMDVTLNPPLHPEETCTVLCEYGLTGILEKGTDAITTRAALLIPIVQESSGKTKIQIEMTGPEGYKCTQAIPQPKEKKIVENKGYSSWEMLMLPPSLLYVTYKPVGTTSVSVNTLILIGIILWIAIVAVYGYKKLM